LAPPGEYNGVQFAAAAAAAMRTVAATAVATSLHRRRFLPENARVHPSVLYGERSLYDDDAVRLIAAGSKSRARAGAM